MELGACDLSSFLKRGGKQLETKDVVRIWCTLVKAVDAAHEKGIIHRDLKPGNFLLVPVTSWGQAVLATTATPKEDFVFRISTTPDNYGQVVDLTVRNAFTGSDDVLPLTIKLTDFGMAQTIGLEDSHLSILGHGGTPLYMAPEALEASENCLQKISKHADIWALGVMLFQLFQAGKSPFDLHFQRGGLIGAILATANENVGGPTRRTKVKLF